MKIEHVALYVNDLEAAKDFFVRYLDAVPNAGYHNPRTDFRSYFLTFADGARLELMNKPGMPDEPKPAARTGYAHIAFSVGSREKVDALIAPIAAYLNETPSRVPFSDWYETVTGEYCHFIARSVQGGIFMPMLIHKNGI